MASSASRRRSSSLRSETGVSELQNHLNTLTRRASGLGTDHNARDIDKELHAGHFVRQSLLESSNSGHIRDTFRHIRGFQAIIGTIEIVSQELGSCESKIGEIQVLLDLLQITIGILAAALQDHNGNKKYFRQRIDGGGWKRLKKCLEPLVTDLHLVKDAGVLEAIIERLFGCMFSCAANDELLAGFFGKLRRHIDSQGRLTQIIDSEQSFQSPASSDSFKPDTQTDDLDPCTIRGFVDVEIDPSIFVHNPEAMVVMVELWHALSNIAATLKILNGPALESVSIGVPYILLRLAGLSTHNLLALHGASLLSIVLSYLLETGLSKSSVSELRDLAATLLQLGATNLDDAHLLFRNASNSPLIADLLLSSMKISHSPSYIHFDLSLHGFASIELPRLGQGFPPLSSSAGYTLSLWMYVVQFDPNAHTTLFGAFDSSQTCFLLVYLEKDTSNLILQTSVTSSKPSVRFKSPTFQKKRWYHISIVHRRPKATSSSRASLFVNGEFMEQVKSQYPSSPPLSTTENDKSSLQPVSRRSNPVQAFIGTPQDLASRLGRGLINSEWRFASVHLFGDTLSDDLIAVHHQLGPKYSGNYQDCLGSFQTYRASAALNLRNESLHPGKEEKSDIVTAIRLKASCLLPESKVLLNISPTTVLDDNDHKNIDENHLVNSLSKSAAKNLRNVTRGGRNALAINGAVPSINEALLHSFGFAVLTGDPAVVVPQSLDDAAWRIGGCAAVGLALFETAQSNDGVLRALEIIFDSVQDSWRNSEAMERENGFGVLGNLIAAKLGAATGRVPNGTQSPTVFRGDHQNLESLSLGIVALILKFVGYRIEKPEDSVIINPLAYRVLIVDFDLWRSAAPAVQKLYYEQFTDFGVNSKYHVFNTKRLSRMRPWHPSLETVLLC